MESQESIAFVTPMHTEPPNLASHRGAETPTSLLLLRVTVFLTCILSNRVPRHTEYMLSHGVPCLAALPHGLYSPTVPTLLSQVGQESGGNHYVQVRIFTQDRRCTSASLTVLAQVYH